MRAIDVRELTAVAVKYFQQAAACLCGAVREAPQALGLTEQSSHRVELGFQYNLSNMSNGLEPSVLALQIGPALLLGQAIVEYSDKIGLKRWHLRMRKLQSPAELMPAKRNWGPGSCFTVAALCGANMQCTLDAYVAERQRPQHALLVLCSNRHARPWSMCVHSGDLRSTSAFIDGEASQARHVKSISSTLAFDQIIV